MGEKNIVRDYYEDLSHLTDLLKTMVDSYRLLIGGAYELNNIPEARTKYVKEAVGRADKLGETIDRLIHLLDECGESYFTYCTQMNEYLLKSNNGKLILTEIDNDLLFQNSYPNAPLTGQQPPIGNQPYNGNGNMGKRAYENDNK